MSGKTGKSYGRTALISGACACWLIYDMGTAQEAPRQAVAILQYLLLAMAAIGSIGSAVMYLKNS